MTNEIVKKDPLAPDQIDAFDDTIAGATDQAGKYLPEGVLIGYGSQGAADRWTTRLGDDITGRPVLHLDTIRTEVHWGRDGKPVGPPRILGPGEQYRDAAVLNAAIDRSEWLPGFEKGQLRGPIQNQNVLVFGDLSNMERFVWPSAVTTIGSAMAVRELTEKVKRMRHFRGSRVFARVEFASCLFHTRFGERQRPHLRIVGWVELAEEGLKQIDPRVLPSLQHTPAPKAQPDAPAAQPAPALRPVSEPTLQEEVNDRIPW